MSTGFRYTRRVQFAETDLEGIVHFSSIFRYMEEAEHAAWREAGLTVSERGGALGWPRVNASFDFRSPLYFEDEMDVIVRIAKVGTRSLLYEHVIMRGDVQIGTGRMTTVCVQKTPGQPMRAAEIPPEVLEKLRRILGPDPSQPG